MGEVGVDSLVAVIVAAVITIVVARRRAIAEIWLRNEDGRTLAALRIATGLLLLLYVAGRSPLHTYLLSDEGLFVREVAQQVHAGASFAGYEQAHLPGAEPGFFNLRGVWAWVTGENHSILMFRDDPPFVRAHELAFYLVCAAFTLGLLTSVTKWLTWFLYLSLLLRGFVGAAGEHVMVNFLVLLCWSRCGEVWSVDGWWRRRRGAPPRLVPAWPRWLMILQTVPMFAANGLRKSGVSWADGDALWFSLSHPGLPRAWATEIPTMLGPVPLRLATWFVHGFEVLFPLVVVGVVATALAGTSPPSARARSACRAAGLVIAAAMVALAFAIYPPVERGRLPFVAVMLHAGWVTALAIGGARRFPPRHRWLVSRRVWVSAAVAFTLPLVLLFDFGPFTAMALATMLAFFSGDEIAFALRRVRITSRGEGTRAIEPEPRAPWRRRAVFVIGVVHIVSLGASSMPRLETVTPARAAIEHPLGTWRAWWGTNQSWKMFAPNGPKTSVDIRVEATLADGRILDLGRGFDADPAFDPGFARDKAEKIARRLAGGAGAGWYRKWHLRYVCRAWALRHEGQPPVSV
jgi:hypothetical protein